MIIHQITYKKYTYKDVEKEINDNYFDDSEYHSRAFDILATYLRGQKLIYMESKAYCEQRLNYLRQQRDGLAGQARPQPGVNSSGINFPTPPGF